jgi:hypothetical protein
MSLLPKANEITPLIKNALTKLRNWLTRQKFRFILGAQSVLVDIAQYFACFCFMKRIS